VSKPLPIAIVVMGVSGSGKTTVAARLAQRLRWEFAEADTFHSPANVEKMRNGTPLTDDDRWPWLDAIAKRIDAARSTGRPLVVACSALRRAYRERLAGTHGDVRFVYLKGCHATIAGRMAGRTGHYMPPSLLKSQFDTLEEPAPEENAVVLSVEDPPEKLVESLAATFS
jgi:gluconokinase